MYGRPRADGGEGAGARVPGFAVRRDTTAFFGGCLECDFGGAYVIICMPKRVTRGALGNRADTPSDAHAL